MIKSMTGFGRSKYEVDSREYNIEIKSVNNRYNDVNVKISKSIGYLEEKIKKTITNSVSRGKVDVYVGVINNSNKGKDISLNIELAHKYIQELEEIAKQTTIKDDISVMEIVKMPDVLNIRTKEEDEDLLWQEIEICLKEALNNFLEMRQVEGEKIKQDIQERIDAISKKLEQICDISSGLVEEYIVKLEKRINDLLKDKTIIEEQRLAQEVVIYSDKCSIEEETTRLKSHIYQFMKFLEEDNAIGKKLDFLIQEMNREINTIGSKANKLDITNLVVDMKTELENIREQVQNIE